MAFQKGQSGNPAGRPKGLANKVPGQVLEDFFYVYKRLGGRRQFLKMCREDADFAKVHVWKVLPDIVLRAIGSLVKIDGEPSGGGGIKVIVQQFKKSGNGTADGSGNKPPV